MAVEVAAPLRPPGAAPPATGLALFDLDRTMIPGSSVARLGRAALRAGLVTRRRLARYASAEAVFSARGLRPDELARIVGLLLSEVAGRDASSLRDLVEEVTDEVNADVYPAARWLVDSHLAGGHRCVLLSASPQELVELVAAALGMSDAVGTQVEIVDGRCTGRLYGPLCHGEGKLIRLRQVVGPLALGTATAYADAESDAAVLRSVGQAVAVNPDRGLRALARREGWPVLRFS